MKHFYNLPENDPFAQSQAVVSRCQEVFREIACMAWNTGSGWVVRKQAIVDIGGFPMDCLTEDVKSAFLMLSKGWNTTYVPETVQYGLVPDSYAAHVKQLCRVSLVSLTHISKLYGSLLLTSYASGYVILKAHPASTQSTFIANTA